MLHELALKKKESSPKFSAAFDFLIKFIWEVDEHLRDMHCWYMWPSIQSYRLNERFDGTYYRSHIAFILDIGEKGTADIEVIETEKGFDVEVEFMSRDGFAVCGTTTSFRFACASLMVF